MCFVAEDNFSAEISVLIQTLQSSLGEQTALSMAISLQLPGLVGFCTDTGLNPDEKFAKLKFVKGRVLVHGEELTASGSSAHFHRQRRRSRYICCSFDVWV
ncbi:hypothetical protein J6590_086168 [Homalodisca vitripennis]|nr:hypothetical protein J6590_086168 [Homalodisca vitripennis]